MSNNREISLNEFAKMIFSLLKSDRDVNMGVAGFTGSGKSTFSTLLQKQYSKISGSYWGFDRMTWDRKELMRWIDGEPQSDINASTGLKKGQLPEYSAVLPDELFHMFYRRNWHDGGQIDAISTFNMCRDRHLFLCGNVPNFWMLDSAFQERMRFYAFVPERGTAWVFQQETNPWTLDPWNKNENMKIFRRNIGKPEKSPNYVCTIKFPDWDAAEKIEYLKIRNTKRVEALQSPSTEIQKFDRSKSILACGHAINYLNVQVGLSVNKIAKEIILIDPKTAFTYSNKALASIPNTSL